jgi:hypothetical protein
MARPSSSPGDGAAQGLARHRAELRGWRGGCPGGQRLALPQLLHRHNGVLGCPVKECLGAERLQQAGSSMAGQSINYKKH